jgi:Kef-type K+ transport system membrane component KefB
VHLDPIAGVALHLAIILVAAKLGAEVAVRLRQPAVLGEILAGLVVGNLGLLGLTFVEGIAGDAAVDTL